MSRSSHHCAGPQAGFTLLEVLVALAVLGMVIAIISAGLQFGLASWRAQTESAARIAELDSIDRLVRTLLTEIDLQKKPPLHGTLDSVSFATLLPRAVAPDQRHVDATLAVTQKHRFVLRWRPAGQAETVPPTETVLLENVAAIEFSYMAKMTGKSAAWRASWEDGLPELVRLRVKFRPDDGRQWPDILAAPVVRLAGQ